MFMIMTTVIFTYKYPVRNLKNTRTQKLLAMLDTNEVIAANKSDAMSGVFLPFVSDKNPHKCDDKITPTYPIPLKIPLSLVDKFKSHCAIGRINLIEVKLRKAQPNIPRESRMTM